MSDWVAGIPKDTSIYAAGGADVQDLALLLGYEPRDAAVHG